MGVKVISSSGAFKSYIPQVSVPSQPKQKAPDVAIAELRKEFEEKMKQQYEETARRLRSERDEALRENWVLQERAKAALPEQLAAAGLNGGATESTLARLNSEYQEGRNDIRKGYISDLGELSEKQAEETAENDRSYNEKWLEYLIALGKIDRESSYGKYY